MLLQAKTINNDTAYIPYSRAIARQKTGDAIVVDVREPAEFHDGHLPDAINLPSTRFEAADYHNWQHLPIYLVCQTGSRARSVAHKLSEAGIQDVYVLDRHMEQIEVQNVPQRWSVDRQFRSVLGVFLALYLIGYHWLSPWFTIVPVIVCLGLIYSAVTDKCYLRIGIAMLPWNREATAAE